MMRTSRWLTAALLTSAMLASACHYQKRNLNLTVFNQSGRVLNNVEIDYPGGIFGFGLLANGKSFQRQIIEASPCKFIVHYDGPGGRQMQQSFELGSKCPQQVNFVFGQDGIPRTQSTK